MTALTSEGSTWNLQLVWSSPGLLDSAATLPSVLLKRGMQLTDDGLRTMPMNAASGFVFRFAVKDFLRSPEAAGVLDLLYLDYTGRARMSRTYTCCPV